MQIRFYLTNLSGRNDLWQKSEIRGKRRRLTKVSAAIFFLSHRFARSEKDIADMSSLGELQCVAGEYISPAATSVPPLEPVPALPVEFVLLRRFFLFLYFWQPRSTFQALQSFGEKRSTL
eukprot:TRINITY_DN1721_c0_g1_i3.p2 TRINITY_DN1721_c0_g1~~TRINITY_DN1721_c0_g1_i3.p2  ORF type:complete len:120 (+),score=3.77 TRINITY_DN1721_c0_g1_i3:158-517(+)